MTSDPNIELRVSRLENDRDSIYELIDDFRAATRTRFDAVEGTLDDFRTETRTRFDAVESTLDEVLRRLPEPS